MWSLARFASGLWQLAADPACCMLINSFVLSFGMSVAVSTKVSAHYYTAPRLRLEHLFCTAHLRCRFAGTV
jgi:hypothetical protein